MKLTAQPNSPTVTLELTLEQLAVLSNGLLNALDLLPEPSTPTEALHGFDSEFSARIGGTRLEAQQLLDELSTLWPEDPHYAPSSLSRPAPKQARVYFVGAGPGASDLITVRGAALLAQCDMVLYAGSLVPEALLEYVRPSAQKHNTAQLSLPQQLELYQQAKQQGLMVVRLHSGDPAIYGATAEQMQALQVLNVGYEVVPGVSSFSACAATLGAELTRPNVTQTIILTRASGRASPVPDAENLASLAAHQASLCIFLGGHQLPENIAELLKHYPPQTPAALVQRASQPQERRHVATLGTLLEGLKLSEWALTTMLLVSPALGSVEELETYSRLYDPQYAHRFRRADGGEEV